MDKNKLKVLQDLPYVIRNVCDSCTHGQFDADQKWGTCLATPYEHIKHQRTHFLTIHRTGHCPKFKREVGASLGDYAQFIEGT